MLEKEDATAPRASARDAMTTSNERRGRRIQRTESCLSVIVRSSESLFRF